METQIIIEILILFTAVYLAFFKSYLTEKGRSAALKEDLHEITKEVESIKSEFTKEQEILKTDLQRILSNEVSYRTEERNALIYYHATINEWLYSILEFSFGNYNKTNIEALISVRNNISSYYAKSGIAKSKIELLVEDQDLISLSQKLYTAALTFHHWTDMEFLKLQQNSESQKSLTDQFLIIIKNFEQNKALAYEMAENEKKLKSEAKTLFDNYMANRNNEYFKVTPIEKDFTNQVKKYLKN